jgi:hypothetical protein
MAPGTFAIFSAISTFYRRSQRSEPTVKLKQLVWISGCISTPQYQKHFRPKFEFSNGFCGGQDVSPQRLSQSCRILRESDGVCFLLCAWHG